MAEAQLTLSTDLGASFVLPIAPEELAIGLQTETATYKTLRAGTFEWSVGNSGETLSFEVLLPANRPTLLNGQPWQEPQNAYIHPLENAIRQAQGRVYLACPEADIGAWYILKTLQQTHAGGYGDVKLALSFVEERQIIVYTASEAGIGGSTTTTANGSPAAPTPATTAAPMQDDGNPHPGSVYVTVDGDTLNSISQRAYGDISYADAVYAANKGAIEGAMGVILNDDALVAGITLNLPS
jgi:phage tail protein X